LKDDGVETVRTPIRSPNMNTHCERVIQSIKTVRSTARCLHTRCGAGYNNVSSRLPVGAVGTRPLVPVAAGLSRRIRTMSRRTVIAPPL
jgi:hypothetical protein